MLGFPDKYLAITIASPEDTRCELAGDAMSVQVRVRLFTTLQELPGAWPPLNLACTENGLVIIPERADDPVSSDTTEHGVEPARGTSGLTTLPGETSDSQQEEPNQEVEAAPEQIADQSSTWVADGQQWLPSSQLGEGSA